jgi:hypothetical protein
VWATSGQIGNRVLAIVPQWSSLLAVPRRNPVGSPPPTAHDLAPVLLDSDVDRTYINNDNTMWFEGSELQLMYTSSLMLVVRRDDSATRGGR